MPSKILHIPGAVFSAPHMAFSIPPNVRFKVLALFFTLTTSAAVATRYVEVQIGTAQCALILFHPDAVAASAVRTFSCAVNVGTRTVSTLTIAQMDLPDVVFPPQGSLIVTGIALDAADVFSAAVAIVEVFEN